MDFMPNVNNNILLIEFVFFHVPLNMELGHHYGKKSSMVNVNLKPHQMSDRVHRNVMKA